MKKKLKKPNIVYRYRKKYKIRHCSMLHIIFQMPIQMIIIPIDISRTKSRRWRGRIISLGSTF